MVHTAGAFALANVATGLSLESVFELIRKNADYIAYLVNKSLKNVSSKLFSGFYK